LNRKPLLTVVAMFAVAAVILMSNAFSGCGDTRKLLAITEGNSAAGAGSQQHDVFGQAGTIQLKIFAHYSNNQPPVDVTALSTYQIAQPPGAAGTVVTISTDGLVTVVGPYCSWEPAGTPGAGSGSGPGPFPPFVLIPNGTALVTVTYKNVSTTVFIAISNAAPCNGPVTTTQNHIHHRRPSVNHPALSAILPR
jgi:hypothetical protein